MFTSDFIYKMEDAGLVVKPFVGNFYSLYSVYDKGSVIVATISTQGDRFLNIHDVIFDLDNPNKVMDILVAYHKTPYDEREDKRYLLYFIDIAGNFKLIQKHYSSVISGYYFSTRENNFDGFVEMLTFVSNSSAENFSRMAISRQEIKQLPDSWKPKQFGGNDVTQCIEVKYWKDDK